MFAVANYGVNSALSRQRQYEAAYMSLGYLQGQSNNTFNVATFTNQAFTICYWVYIDVYHAANFYNSTGRETSSSNKTFQDLIYTNGTTTIAFNTHVAGTTAQQLAVTTPVAPTVDKWYFVAMTATTSGPRKDMHLYDENGFIVSGTTSTYGGNLNSSNIPLCIGASRTNTNWQKGTMNSYGFWNTYKSPDFIKSIWNSGRGLQYTDLTTDQKTGMVEWFDLSDWDGSNCVGQFGGHILSRVGGTVTEVSVTP